MLSEVRGTFQVRSNCARILLYRHLLKFLSFISLQYVGFRGNARMLRDRLFGGTLRRRCKEVPAKNFPKGATYLL